MFACMYLYTYMCMRMHASMRAINWQFLLSPRRLLTNNMRMKQAA
jgi:hypothetical protein